jgi:serine protease AprX
MEDGDYMTVDVSKDGGATWSETKRIYGKSLLGIDPGWHAVYVDISSFISSNVAVRFVTNFQNNDYYDSIYLDNIQIVFNDPVTLAQPNTYLQTLNVQPVWDMGINGAGVTIAVVDSGVALDSDFSSTPGQLTADRVLLQLGFNQAAETVVDAYGHGTHVAGIIAGNGTKSEGYYKGIAPGANLISLRVSDDYGMSYESDVVAALQWIYNNKSTYNIRVVNLSLNSTTEASYHNSPLNAAVEILWFNGVVVVASAGNTGGGTFNTADAAPANDPFIITVGASDEQYTASRADDLWASFSANGTTMDGHAKPDIVAPGRNIISVLASSSWWRNDYPDRFLEGGYFRIGGTSMSAPMVTGAVALLLQDEPNLNPDQVKYRLLNGAGVIIGKLGDDTNHAYPYLDVYAAVTGTTTGSANQGIMPSLMLASGEDAIDFASVGWNSVGWNSVGWNSVGWNSVGWNSVGWNSVGWNSVGWNSTYWGE